MDWVEEINGAAADDLAAKHSGQSGRARKPHLLGDDVLQMIDGEADLAFALDEDQNMLRCFRQG